MRPTQISDHDTLVAKRRRGRPLGGAAINRRGALPGQVTEASGIGAIIRHRRVSLRQSQAEMAAMLGISRGLLMRLESGAGNVSLERTLQVLADLGIGVRLLTPSDRTTVTAKPTAEGAVPRVAGTPSR